MTKWATTIVVAQQQLRLLPDQLISVTDEEDTGSSSHRRMKRAARGSGLARRGPAGGFDAWTSEWASGNKMREKDPKTTGEG
jgi:hypothetical protein